MKQLLSLIVAMDKNGLIGVDNRLPWRLPDDMKWFVEQTMGKPVLMGRKTYDSIPSKFKPLHGRQTIVLTRNRAYEAAGCAVVHSLEQALDAAANAPELMVAGGADLYGQCLARADRLYVTLVEGEFAGDTYFPSFDWQAWQPVFRRRHAADERHAYSFSWLILARPSSA